MDEDKIQKCVNRIIGNSVFIGNKDDLYNLSVRKNALSHCVSALENLIKLAACYGKLSENDIKINGFLKENGQIKSICLGIFKTLNAKTEEICGEEKISCKGEKLLDYASEILVNLLSDILSLAQIMNIRRTERELVFASHTLVNQLLYIKSLY